MYTVPLNFVCGLIVPGFASTWPRSTSSFSTPRSSTPMLSPASPEVSSLRNISTPVTTFFSVGLNPTISISSPTFTRPRSTPPATTAPRPPARARAAHGAAGAGRAATRDREHVFDRHHERLFHVTLRERDIAVERIHQLRDAADA